MAHSSTKLRKAYQIGLWILVTFVLSLTGAVAEPLPGGTLDPLTIPKYVIPLVIPPEMPKSTRQPGFPSAEYNIAVRQFKQQILPGGIWNSVNGRTDMFGATTIWSYGRDQDKVPSNFVAPTPLSNNISFNYPAFTLENVSGNSTSVRWINDLVDKQGNYLPHLLKNAVDQTLHWANPPATGCTDGTNRTDCATNNPEPYTGPVPLVTHVHGAHVNPKSDGYPEAWWLPAAKNIPAGYARKGDVFDQYFRFNTLPGSAYYNYENDQPATTLWYHDHALGMTRLNVYAGPAGFWLIRGGMNGDSHVKDNNGFPALLPGPAPRAGHGDPNFDAATRARIREIPIVIQDRSFNADGSLFYPENRAFFEGLNVPGVFPPQLPGSGVLDVPFIGDASQPSDMAPIWNPEAFFNTMVVNGNTWPKLDVAPALYRLRLLDGCNSRFLNLALFIVTGPGPDGQFGTADDQLGDEIPFFQIGAEQGFLPKVAMIRTGFATPLPGDGTIPAVETPQDSPQHALLIGLAERADVIVDFRGMADGTIVRMINTAPDAPFGGFPDDPADPGTTGQVMQFVVNSGLTQVTDADATPPENLVLPAEAKLGDSVHTRQLSLNEEMSGQVCVTVPPVDGGDVVAIPGVPFDPANPAVFEDACATAGGIPFGPKAALLGTVDIATGTSTPLRWMAPVTEKPILGDTETWEIYNLTADGHPIHLHLVRFEVVNRQALVIDPVTEEPTPVIDESAEPTGPKPWETGFKDTVVALPGEVTRIKAKFDKPGLYVWHCHIVEHEDNEMMRPYYVRVNPQFPDFNLDGKVNVKDMLTLLAEIVQAEPRNPGYDLNDDGKVDIKDLLFFKKVAKNL